MIISQNKAEKGKVSRKAVRRGECRGVGEVIPSKRPLLPLTSHGFVIDDMPSILVDGRDREPGLFDKGKV